MVENISGSKIMVHEEIKDNIQDTYEMYNMTIKKSPFDPIDFHFKDRLFISK